METLKLKFVGKGDLLMHSDRAMNLLDEQTKQFKALVGKRKKTEEDYEAIARLEWELGLYFDQGLGPFIPAINIEGCIRDGGKMEKRGEDVKKATQVLQDKVTLQYKGPRDIEGLWAKKFYDIRTVGNQQNKVMRCRPIFRGWSIEFPIAFDPAIFNAEDLVRCAQLGGAYCGLCDYTPRFGRFDVEKLNGKA